MNKINNYNDLITVADSIGQELNKNKENILNDSDIDKIAKLLDDESEKNVSVQDLLNAKKESEEYVENGGNGENDIGLCVIDPSSGNVKNIIDIDSLPYSDASLNDIINNPNIICEDIDVKNSKVTKDNIDKVIKDIFGEIHENIQAQDINTIINVANKYKNGEKFSYYNSLPKSIQNLINMGMGGETLSSMGNFKKQGRNYVAEQFLQYIIQESVINTELIDLQSSVNKDISKLYDDSKKIISNTIINQKKYYEETIIEIASKLEEQGNIEKAEILRRCSSSFKESYTLKNLLLLYKFGKLKVKKIQIEKFGRTCSDFNMKFKKSKNVIPELSLILPVLDRHVNKKYDLVVIQEFICIFIKYTWSFSATNIEEYIYMYYFITNILSLDYYDKNNKEDVEFHENILSNINIFLEEICQNK